MNNTYELIPAASITIDPERYQARLEGLDSEHVASLVESYNPQSTKEAIQVVLTDSGQYILTDGFHRCEAIRVGNLATEVMAEVVRGDADKAFVLSRAANFRNGKNLSPADTKRSIEDLLKLAPNFGYDPKAVTNYLVSVNVPSRTASRYTSEIRNSITEKRNRKIVEMRDAECTHKTISQEVGFDTRTVMRVLEEMTKKTAVQNVTMFDDGPVIPVWDDGIPYDEWLESHKKRKEEEANDTQLWWKRRLAQEAVERKITSKQYDGVILAASEDDSWLDKKARLIRERANHILFKADSINNVIERGFDAIYTEPHRGEVIGMPLGQREALESPIWESVFKTEYIPEDDCLDTACCDAESIERKRRLRLDITKYGYYDINNAHGLPQNCSITTAPPCPVLKKLREQVWEDIEILFFMLDGAREAGELSFMQVAKALPWKYYGSETTISSCNRLPHKGTPSFLLAVRILEGMEKPYLCTGKDYGEHSVSETAPAAVPLMIPDNYLDQPASAKKIADQITKLSNRWAFLMRCFDERYDNVYRWHIMGHGDRYRSVLMVKDMLLRIEQFARKTPEYKKIQETLITVNGDPKKGTTLKRKSSLTKLRFEMDRSKPSVEERKSRNRNPINSEKVACPTE